MAKKKIFTTLIDPKLHKRLQKAGGKIHETVDAALRLYFDEQKIKS